MWGRKNEGEEKNKGGKVKERRRTLSSRQRKKRKIGCDRQETGSE